MPAVKFASDVATWRPCSVSAKPASATQPLSFFFHTMIAFVTADSTMTAPAMFSRPAGTRSRVRNGIMNSVATGASTSATRHSSGKPIVPTPRCSPTHSHIT